MREVPAAKAPASLDRIGPPVLIVFAFLLFVAIQLYGLTSPFYYGHYGFHGGEYATWARGTLRFHTIYPVNVPGYALPSPGNYYIHHPVMPHQLVVLSFLVLGEHEYAIRIAAMVSPLVSMALIALLVWRWMGRWQSGFAALLFAIVPINVWYGSHIDQGFPSIACLLAFLWFYLAWLSTGHWRAAALALFFQGAAGLFEWSPYVAFPFLFAHALWMAVKHGGRFRWFAALHPLAFILPLGFHVLLVRRAGLWDDWLKAYHVRTASIPYQTFLHRMAEYGDTLYGRVLMVLTALWLVGLVVRLGLGRARPRDLIGATFAFALIAYALTFREAIVTHAYRQLYGNVAATLAATETLHQVVAFLGQRAALGRLPRPTSLVAAVVGALVVLLPTARVARSGQLESRAHGGIPGWGAFNPELDKAVLARHVHDITRPGDVLYFHASYVAPPPHRKDCAFYYDKDVRPRFPLRTLDRLTAAERAHAVVIVAPGNLQGDDALAYAQWARKHPTFRVGAFAAIDLRDDHPRYDVFRLAPEGVARSRFGRYLDGPYPWPVLIADPAAALRESAALDVRLAGEAAVAAPVPSPPVPPRKPVVKRRQRAPSRGGSR